MAPPSGDATGLGFSLADWRRRTRAEPDFWQRLDELPDASEACLVRPPQHFYIGEGDDEDDFTEPVDAPVYHIVPGGEEVFAYPNASFARIATDGWAMTCPEGTLSTGINQSMDDVECGKTYDSYFPPSFLRFLDGPAANIAGTRRFGVACCGFGQGGDLIKSDVPHGNRMICQTSVCIPEVAAALTACFQETGEQVVFSTTMTADDPCETIAREKYIRGQSGQCADAPDDVKAKIRGKGGRVPVCRPQVSNEMVARGKYVLGQFVHARISQVSGTRGIHVGPMGSGQLEDDASDRILVFMLRDDEADGPYYHQEWQCMNQTTLFLSGGMNTLRLPAFFENLGFSNVVFAQKDSNHIYPGSYGKLGYTGESFVQGEEVWLNCNSGVFGNVSLSDGGSEYAKTQEEIKGAFLTFQKDSDQIDPGSYEKICYTDESSVQGEEVWPNCNSGVFGNVCFSVGVSEFGLGHGLIVNDVLRGNRTLCQASVCIPEVAAALTACFQETGEQKILSANTTADDPYEIIAREKYSLGLFGEYADRAFFSNEVGDGWGKVFGVSLLSFTDI